MGEEEAPSSLVQVPTAEDSTDAACRLLPHQSLKPETPSLKRPDSRLHPGPVSATRTLLS